MLCKANSSELSQFGHGEIPTYGRPKPALVSEVRVQPGQVRSGGLLLVPYDCEQWSKLGHARLCGGPKAVKDGYPEMLRRDPQNAKALHLRGCVYHERPNYAVVLTVEARAVLRTHVLPFPSALSTETWPPPGTIWPY